MNNPLYVAPDTVAEIASTASVQDKVVKMMTIVVIKITGHTVQIVCFHFL